MSSLKKIPADKVIRKYFREADVELSLDDKIVKKEISIDSKKCLACNVCVEACPIGAISPNIPQSPTISKNCVYCYTCVEACPVNAIEIKYIVGRIYKGKMILEKWAKNKELIYNKMKCISCLVCMKNCPFCAISKLNNDDGVEFNKEKCKLCGYCGKICPSDAIDFKGIKMD
jgi:ferredoxin